MAMDNNAIEAIAAMPMELQEQRNVNLPLYEQQLMFIKTAAPSLSELIRQAEGGCCLSQTEGGPF